MAQLKTYLVIHELPIVIVDGGIPTSFDPGQTFQEFDNNSSVILNLEQEKIVPLSGTGADDALGFVPGAGGGSVITIGGGQEDLALTLQIGNETGLNDIVITTGRKIMGGRACFGASDHVGTDGDISSHTTTGPGGFLYDASEVKLTVGEGFIAQGQQTDNYAPGPTSGFFTSDLFLVSGADGTTNEHGRTLEVLTGEGNGTGFNAGALLLHTGGDVRTDSHPGGYIEIHPGDSINYNGSTIGIWGASSTQTGASPVIGGQISLPAGAVNGSNVGNISGSITIQGGPCNVPGGSGGLGGDIIIDAGWTQDPGGANARNPGEILIGTFTQPFGGKYSDDGWGWGPPASTPGPTIRIGKTGSTTFITGNTSIDGVATITNRLNIGTTTLASGTGDLAAGLTGDAQLFYNSNGAGGHGSLQLTNSSGSLRLEASGEGYLRVGLSTDAVDAGDISAHTAPSGGLFYDASAAVLNLNLDPTVAGDGLFLAGKLNHPWKGPTAIVGAQDAPSGSTGNGGNLTLCGGSSDGAGNQGWVWLTPGGPLDDTVNAESAYISGGWVGKNAVGVKAGSVFIDAGTYHDDGGTGTGWAHGGDVVIYARPGRIGTAHVGTPAVNGGSLDLRCGTPLNGGTTGRIRFNEHTGGPLNLLGSISRDGWTSAGAFGNANNSESFGWTAVASGSFAVAVGRSAVASGNRGIAIGYLATAASTGTVNAPISIGAQSSTNAEQSVAVGGQATTTGVNGTAVGFLSTAAQEGTSLGVLATTVSGATALGTYTVASGSSAIAVGGSADATAARSVAIGLSAQATHTESITLGAGAASNAANQFVVGGFQYPVTTAFIGYGSRRGSTGAMADLILSTTDRDTRVDESGQSLVIRSGRGTGASAPTTITFRTPDATTSGTTQQTLVDRLVLDDSGVSMPGPGAATAGILYADAVIDFSVSDTASGLIPAGAIPVGVNTYVTGTISGGGATGYQIGDGTDVDRWGSINSLTAGTDSDPTDYTDTALIWGATASDVTLTGIGGTPTAGTVHVVVSYISFTAPTS